MTRAVDLTAHRDRCLADVDDLVVDPDRGAVLDRAGALDPVEHRDAGAGQDLGTEVGIAAGDHRRDVHDRGHAGVDECLGGGPIHVEMVEDGDVAGAQPGQEHVRTPLDAGGAGDPREDDAVLGANR